MTADKKKNLFKMVHKYTNQYEFNLIYFYYQEINFTTQGLGNQ